MSTEKMLHASTTPIHADEGVLLDRVDDLWQADNDERTAHLATSFQFPDELGERAIHFFRYYLARTRNYIPSRRHYNCHIFTAAVRGWLQVGEFDPNLFEGGSADIIWPDRYPFVDPSEVVTGTAYGIVAINDPFHLVHTFVGIDATRHIAVKGNAEEMVIADTNSVMQHYERKLGQVVQLCVMHDKPSVIGTDHWKTGQASPLAWSSRAYWQIWRRNKDAAVE